jgi:hypothetical protein
MSDFPKPGPEHQRLKRLTGAWAASIKYFPGNGAPPEESHGEVLARMDLGGYFLCRDINFGLAGYQGRGLTGWDAFQNTYTGTWVDSTSPIIYQTRGHFDERGIYCETSEGPDANGEVVRIRMTTEVVDPGTAASDGPNKMLFRMYRLLDKQGDREEMSLEITHTRRRFVQ